MRKLELIVSICVLWVAIDSALGCGTHGTIGGPPATLRADVFGDQDGDGLINGRIGIVDTFIAPTSSTNCVAAIGLGNLGITAPSGIQVTSAEIAVVNQRTGLATPLREFSFFSSSTTTAGMATGGNGILPLFSGSAWFGFQSTVNPFILPSLGPDEEFELLFELELPPESLPLALPVQFAAGEGDATGSPIFTGSHPVGYFTADNAIATFAVPEPRAIAVWSLVGSILAGFSFYHVRRKK